MKKFILPAINECTGLTAFVFAMLAGIITTLFLLVFAGCSTENPICTDSFCLIPRDTVDESQPVIEIDESKVLALIGKTPETTETVIPPTPKTPIIVDRTFADIISDVVSGNTAYLEKTVTITASVRFNLAERGSGTSLSLETHTDDVFFFITDRDTPKTLHIYNELTTYTFKVYIRSISPPNEKFDDYSVFSHIVE